MKTSKGQKPQGKYMFVFDWERSLDPWHKDAFPAEFRDTVEQHLGGGGPRQEGWMGVDWVGNPIVFIPDGTEEKGGE